MNATIEKVLEAPEVETAPNLLYEAPPQLDEPQREPMTQRRVLALATPIIGASTM